MTLSERITRHKKYDSWYWQYLARITKRDGEEGALKILDHPKVTRENGIYILEMAADQKVGTAMQWLENPKTKSGNIRDFLRVARKHGIHTALKVWEHPKVTEKNFKEVMAVVEAHGTEPTLIALEDPKMQVNSIRGVARDLAGQAKILEKEGISREQTHGYQREFFGKKHYPTPAAIRQLHEIRTRNKSKSRKRHKR